MKLKLSIALIAFLTLGASFAVAGIVNDAGTAAVNPFSTADYVTLSRRVLSLYELAQTELAPVHSSDERGRRHRMPDAGVR